ncbi:hypothetical protein [Streptomyces formicae]|uniref:Regulatory protein n=1 Tax=Streptomyces formicae TaxID=1616117 RepID=A0ABY3WRW9_9ACTN|nr:hypothetical protein [Streptomyces formicae]UNM13251.1 hypothetical protein J4032_18710 [Streptomyces formicae]
MTDEQDNTNSQDQYAAQIAAVLKANTQEQDRVRSQITDLQARLVRLQQDHKLLSEMCSTQAGAPVTPVKDDAAAAPRSEAESPSGRVDTGSGETAAQRAVPQPRRAKAQKAAPSRQKKATQSKPRPTAKPPKAATDKPVPLRVLVQDLLTSEPQKVKQLVQALNETHPKREVDNPQLVRNALNALIAKGLAERSKRGTDVFYSASGNGAATVSVPGSDAENATAGERTAAEV